MRINGYEASSTGLVATAIGSAGVLCLSTYFRRPLSQTVGLTCGIAAAGMLLSVQVHRRVNQIRAKAEAVLARPTAIEVISQPIVTDKMLARKVLYCLENYKSGSMIMLVEKGSIDWSIRREYQRDADFYGYCANVLKVADAAASVPDPDGIVALAANLALCRFAARDNWKFDSRDSVPVYEWPQPSDLKNWEEWFEWGTIDHKAATKQRSYLEEVTSNLGITGPGDWPFFQLVPKITTPRANEKWLRARHVFENLA